MAPECEAHVLIQASIVFVSIQLCPVADARPGSVRTDYPAGAHQFTGHQSAFRMQSRDRRLPQHANTTPRRSFDHHAVQMCPPHSIGRSPRKFSLGLCPAADETNAAEGIGFARRNLDAEVAQSFDSIRQKALAARLVDRRKRAIRYDHAQAATARRDRSRQAGWPTSGDKHIPRLGERERHKAIHVSIEMRYW